MSARLVVHEMPPPGGAFTSCCLTQTGELPLLNVFTRDPGLVTCTVRHTAQLAVDTDRGESPFGWSTP
ncbi:hypothetical protein [Streptomyces sp. Root369]|uniref:hypothetical protein n=1 Tax=Streptomyces sp. Root369 TaxID=1736523 RepID=UPI00070A66E6|nr:hypothetical protein [Streptomyces sp. Root369]KQW13575.1 hypothetical protein ASD08_30900 [Streptomyces sp. Root369]